MPRSISNESVPHRESTVQRYRYKIDRCRGYLYEKISIPFIGIDRASTKEEKYFKVCYTGTQTINYPFEQFYETDRTFVLHPFVLRLRDGFANQWSPL